jgi:purine nucleosidase
MASSQTTPILLDTDIGSDIDDAVALAYLLKQPRCDLLGINTVTGHSRSLASMAAADC